MNPTAANVQGNADLAFPSFSKRAARRMIQRAFVLAGRDRNVRQHTRSARIATLWVLEDWEFDWTVILDRGRVSIERRPVKRPDLTLTWPSAAGFFRLIEAGGDAEAEIKREGDPAAWAKARPLLHAFCTCLREVLADPVDENGVSLV